MAAFELNDFVGLVAQPEFILNLGRLSDYADEEKGVAGFVAQRVGNNPRAQVSPVQYPGRPENEGRTFELIPEDALDGLGIYLTGRPVPEEGPRSDAFLTSIPTMADMQTFCRLHERHPKIIGGLVVPLLLSGSVALLFRESETRGFDATAATSLPLSEISGPEHLNEAFGGVGLNWAYFDVTGSFRGRTVFFGQPSRLFE